MFPAPVAGVLDRAEVTLAPGWAGREEGLLPAAVSGVTGVPAVGAQVGLLSGQLCLRTFHKADACWIECDQHGRRHAKCSARPMQQDLCSARPMQQDPVIKMNIVYMCASETRVYIELLRLTDYA